MAFQLRGTAYHVFTGDDVQRGFITLFFAFHQRPLAIARSIGSSTTGPTAVVTQIDLSNQINDIITNAADSIDAGNGIYLLGFTNHMNLIAMTVFRASVHLIDIRKRRLDTASASSLPIKPRPYYLRQNVMLS